MQNLPSGCVRFGAFELDLSTGELRSIEAPDPNHKIPLREQVFQVLRMLLEREGKIVTREEIKSRLWPNDTVVDFDQSINAAIKTLRRALGDSADDPRYIETLARRGYRLMLEIEYLESAPGIAPEEVTVKLPPISGRWRQALAAGALLAVGALSVWRSEVYRHRVTLAPTDTIVLADVDNRTNDPVFDGALNTALRYEMEQTPYLNLLGLGKTYATMGQMKLAPTSKITPEIARQICSKTNSKMVISDSIADAGNGYHLEIRALDCGSGATLAKEGIDTSARNQIVHELGATAARLRRKLGEPAESLARFNQPLEIATSASLEALQTGTEGMKLFLAGNPQAALPLFQRGIELDPDFALLYEDIGRANGALSHYDLMATGMMRAYQLRDRMTEKNRLNTEYLYYSHATGELDKAYSALLRALEIFPRDVSFHNNLAHTMLALGQLTRAADVEDETARMQPSPLHFSSAAGANLNASRFNEAGSWLARAEASKFDSPDLRMLRSRLAFIQGNRAALDQVFHGERMSRIESLSSVSDMKLSRVTLVSPIIGDFRHRSCSRTR
jgi:DNA-binding winged helix-turn-helix (wHTH) protein